jgi:hypothetical protein
MGRGRRRENLKIVGFPTEIKIAAPRLSVKFTLIPSLFVVDSNDTPRPGLFVSGDPY